MLKTKLLKTALMVAFTTATLSVFADEAPVFDADNYPPQFDGQSDAGAPANSQPSSSEGSGQSHVQTYAAPSSNLSIDQRVTQIEQQIANMQHSDSSARLDALHNELQALRGQVDNLNHQLQQLQSQQKSMYSDLDKRISSKPAASQPDLSADSDDTVKPVVSKKKPAKAKEVVAKDQPADVSTTPDTMPAAATPISSKSAAQPNVAEEQQVYQTAYDLIKAKKYDQAIASLRGMLNKYPTGQFAANAHYWLGELYGLQNKNDQSAVEFATVVKSYPGSPKVSDAQLKLGLIYAAQFKWGDAKSSFKKVINHYPGTASARLAAEQLKQIKLAGH